LPCSRSPLRPHQPETEIRMTVQVLLDLAETLHTAPDPLARFSEFAQTRGAKGFFYGFSAFRNDISDLGYTAGIFHHHTYSAEWQAKIGAEALLDNDHAVAAMADGARMVEWLPEDLGNFLDGLTPSQRCQFEIEQDLGMTCGASLLLDDRPFGLSGIGLWLDCAPETAAFRRLWAAEGEVLTAAANLLDAAVRGDRTNLLVRLSPREIDCLSWLARGLRPAEICWRMKISEKTFEKHIASAKAKLKSQTRDQALAKAVLMRLLPL